MLCLFLFYFGTVFSQVTIGSSGTPRTGALLDLKERDVSGGDANSSRGLGMPRVKLTVPNRLDDLGTGLDAAAHTAVMVYNTDENYYFCPGLYVWDGSYWQPLSDSGAAIFKDVRHKADGTAEVNTYHYREIGNAGVWMLENIRATTYADNLGIDKQNNDLTLSKTLPSAGSKVYHYPNFNTSSLDNPQTIAHGLLYSWAGATNGKTLAKNEGEGGQDEELIGVQGVCPQGWHMPSDKEWNDLEQEISKAKPGIYWYDLNFIPNVLTDVNRREAKWRNEGPNGHAKAMKNQSGSGLSKRFCDGGGINILMTGAVVSGVYYEFGMSSYFWPSSSATGWGAWFRDFDYGGQFGVNRYVQQIGSHMYSVRCKRD